MHSAEPSDRSVARLAVANVPPIAATDRLFSSINCRKITHTAMATSAGAHRAHDKRGTPASSISEFGTVMSARDNEIFNEINLWLEALRTGIPGDTATIEDSKTIAAPTTWQAKGEPWLSK